MSLNIKDPETQNAPSATEQAEMIADIQAIAARFRELAGPGALPDHGELLYDPVTGLPRDEGTDFGQTDIKSAV